MTTTSFEVSFLPSKKDILFRLFNNGHITFDELWILAQDTIVTNYISQPQSSLPYSPLVTYAANPTDTNYLQKGFSPSDTL